MIGAGQVHPSGAGLDGGAARVLFESASTPQLLLSPDSFRVLAVSEAYLRAMRVDRSVLIGQPLIAILGSDILRIPRDAGAALCASLRRVREAGIEERMPVQRWAASEGEGRDGNAPDGTEILSWTWINTPVLNTGRAVDYVIHHAEDVTEREAERLRLQEAVKFRDIAERTARLGIWEVDVATGSVTWSREAKAILDFPSGHAPSLQEAMSLVPPDGRAGIRSLFMASIRAGREFGTEFQIVVPRGWRKWVRVVGEGERDEQGRVRRISGTIQNLSERKALEDSNPRLSEALTSRVSVMTNAFLTLDPGFRVTYANPVAIRMLNLPEGVSAGYLLSERPGFEATGVLGTRLREASIVGETMTFEACFEPTGRWLDVHAFPSEEGLTITLHDVTSRRREREKLRLLEACVEHINDLVVITEAGPIDEPGPRVVFVNEAFERRTGHTRDEVYGRTPRILQGSGTQRAELDRVRDALSAWMPVRAELINYTKAGEEFWIEIDIVPVAEATGRITHWVALERDITDRRRSQAKLEEQAALLDQVQDSIVVRLMDGEITYLNRAAEQMYGWTTEEIVGRRVQDVVYDSPDVIAGPTAELLATGRWAGRLPQRRKDGTIIVVEARWTMMRHADGSPRAILVVNTDITERLELEEKLRQSQRLEAVGQLTGGVAHDFNNLLTVILGNAEVLMESLTNDEELRDMAEMTVAAAERGAALTSRLLAFSRRQALDPKVTDVNALLAGIATLLQRTIGAHIDLRIAAAKDAWTALIDPPQLENAVLNLCINARDAMSSGGKLTIETRNVDLDPDYADAEGELAPGQYVMVAVSDTGTGMSPDVVARAFEPFFTTKEVGQGSGLGLSMVYGFMKQSGGHVKIYSTPGLGTAIRMYLPRARKRPVVVPPPVIMKEAGGSERVLLVEDDVMVRDHVAAQLRELGYMVTLVADATEALQALRSSREYDLLFTDVVMPGAINGLRLAAMAKELHPDLRVLLTSGYTENAIAQHGALEPGVRLLNKPYRRRELAETVRRVLDRVS